MMRKNLLVLVCSILIFTCQTRTPVSAFTPVLLNFQDIKPVETGIASLSFTLPLDEVERISFDYTGVVDQSTSRTIPAERISFTHQQQTVSAGQTLEMDPDQWRGGRPSLERPGDYTINIKFIPSDPPGKYEGMIEAVCQSVGGEAKRIPLMLKVNVLPWIKLQTAVPNQLLVIDEVAFRGGTEIKSRQPVSILVASNASWQLYMKVENMLTSKSEPVPIELSVHPSADYEGFDSQFYPYDGYKLVAVGPSTVAGDGPQHSGYWTELVFSAMIPQAHHYPTGQYTFGLNFSGITLER